jgi:hypothetical protein
VHPCFFCRALLISLSGILSPRASPYPNPSLCCTSYDIFVDVCPSGAADQRPSGRALAASGEGSNNAAGCATNYDPCRDDHTTTYLNAPSVKAAIHANASITWAGCSSVVNYSRFDLLSSMIPTYEFLFQQGLRILVFSGDVDAIVPTLGTREWLRLLPLVEAEGIRPWTVDTQVGGWVTQYDKLTFATIRNAGHSACPLTPFSMRPQPTLHAVFFFFSQFYTRTLSLPYPSPPLSTQWSLSGSQSAVCTW